MDIDEKIFEFAYRMALDDATVQAAYKSSGEGSKTRLRGCVDAREAVRAYIVGIFEESSQPNFSETAENVMRAFERYRTSGNDGQFTFGNAQKLINMTAKYMFIATYGKPELRERFKQCHCPMDSVMLKKVAMEAGRAVDEGETSGALWVFANTCAKKRPRKQDWTVADGLKWSSLESNDERYQCFQGAVQELAKRKDLSPIEYDFFAWT